jgi:hypothetical protein
MLTAPESVCLPVDRHHQVVAELRLVAEALVQCGLTGGQKRSRWPGSRTLEIGKAIVRASSTVIIGLLEARAT